MTDSFLQFLGLVKRSGNLLEGYNRCEEAIQKNKKIYLIILSMDLSPKSRKEFLKYCHEKGIKCIECYSKEELGSSVGRQEINILAVLNKNMSDKLMDSYKG